MAAELEALHEDAFGVYRRLREEDPVHWSEVLQMWLLVRYDDVDHVLTTPARFSVDRFRAVGEEFARRRPDMQDVAAIMRDWAVYRDPPDHTRLRAFLNGSFVPRQIQQMRPRIQRIVDGLLDEAAERRRIDFVADVAFPLPASVIAAMLGVPNEDIAQLKAWSNQIAAYIGGAHRGDDIERAKQGLRATCDYFRYLLRARRGRPVDDVLGLLLDARDAGGRLSEDEIVSNCVLLLFAGHETTTNLLGSGLWLLLRHPAAEQRLRGDPDLVPTAVEEFLRCEPPVAGTIRLVTDDVVLGGLRIRCGQAIGAMIAAANRDPARFDCPEELDVGRSPNRHLAFGYGIHFCLGAGLARLEAELAFRSLLQRFRRFRLRDPGPRRKRQLFFRALETLPVELEP